MIQKQLSKLKENWLLIAVILGVFFIFTNGIGMFSSGLGDSSNSYYNSIDAMEMQADGGMRFAKSSRGYNSHYYENEDFVPEETERKITKNAYMTTTVDHGEYKKAEQQVLDLVKSSQLILLQHNSNKRGSDRHAYYQGYFEIKVNVNTYEHIISELESIGQVDSFSESMDDITANIVNLEVELESEQARLQRYETLYEETSDVEYKLTLTDRIFNQERKIKYLQQQLNNAETKVQYSTVRLTLNEERPSYVDIEFVKFPRLVEDFVDSFNALLRFISSTILWILLIVVGIIIYKKFKH